MKHTTELVFILDRSGSMSGLETDTIGGFNSMIAKQKKEAGEALVSTVLFDNESVVIHDRLPLEDVPPTASSSAVQPRVKYSFSVMGGTSSSGRRSWMTTLSVSNSTVETSASPASFFYFSIMELKPPMVSFSSPLIEPLRSRIKTNSVIVKTLLCFVHSVSHRQRRVWSHNGRHFWGTTL